MKQRSFIYSVAFFVTFMLMMLAFSFWASIAPPANAQSAPTFTLTYTPPATATLSGPVVYSPDQLNIRSGPSVAFPQVGFLVSGQQTPLLGRSESGSWIQVEYLGAPDNKGWISRDLVQIRGIDFNAIEIIEFDSTPPPPPTASPPPEVLQLIEERDGEATVVPTYTYPATLAVQTFADPSPTAPSVPPAMIMMGLLAVTIVFGGLSIVRRRI